MSSAITYKRSLEKSPNGGKKHFRKEARFQRLYPFRFGAHVEVKLRRSRNGTNPVQRATLDSLRLKRPGQVKVIRYHGPTTGGMLHVVDHLVEVRLADPPMHGASTRGGNGSRSTGPSTPESTVSTRTYPSGGGESQLLEVSNGGLLRVEAQKESFALMWPSPLKAGEFFRVAKSHWWSDEGEASLLSIHSGGINKIPVDKLAGQLRSRQAWQFVRVDFDDRALTWAPEYRDLERAGAQKSSGVEKAHEVSLSGTRFDPTFVTALIKGTAVEPIAERVDQLVAAAKKTLKAYT